VVAVKVSLEYAPNRSRYQKTQTKASSNTTITTTYIGKLYEQIKQNTSTEHKHFIYADGQLIAINIKTNTTAGTPPIPVVVAVAFSKAFGFVKGSPLDDFVIVFGHVAVGIVGVAPILIVGVGILSESFQYDGLDRLTQSNTTGSIAGVDYNDTTSYRYDINGNIIHKSDIGNYNYNTPSQANLQYYL
jgi:hypothetical protein